MARRQLYIIVLTCLLLVSCNSLWVPSNIKRHFNNCYDEENSGLDSIINISGYYLSLKEYDRIIYKPTFQADIDTHKIDTFQLDFYFASDGMFYYNCGFDGEFKMKRKNSSKFLFSCLGNGCYSLHGDTIIGQIISKMGVQHNYAGWEKKFVILDKNTLLHIKTFSPLHRSKISQASLDELEMQKKLRDEKFVNRYGRKNLDEDTLKFIPFEKIPPSDSWLKKKKWFWCDKEEFKQWKKNRKLKSK